LNKPTQTINPLKLILKSLFLFVILNILFAYLFPNIAQFSLVGYIFPRLDQFPIYVRYSDPQANHGIGIQNIFDVDVLFGMHAIFESKKSEKDYRVFFIGDSRTRNGGVDSALNSARLKTCNSKTIHVYNFGYFGASIIQDLLLLQEAMKYNPDLIVWSISPEALLGEPKDFARANPDRLLNLVNTYNLPIAQNRLPKSNTSFIKSSIIGRRQQLMLQVRLNLDYWILGNALDGNNQTVNPILFKDASLLQSKTLQENLNQMEQTSEIINGAVKVAPKVTPKATPKATPIYLFDALATGEMMAHNVPIILINVPKIINRSGAQENARYRNLLTGVNAEHRWAYLDLWDSIPKSEYLDGVHWTSAGAKRIEKVLVPSILSIACGTK
jgi:hypothetical protein